MSREATARTMAIGNTNSETAAPLSTVAVIVAVGLVVAYLIAVALQWNERDASEVLYGRGLHLIGGLEALAFAAAGALLGNAVQRQVTEEAKKKASDEKKRADENAAAGEAGRAMVSLARAKVSASSEGVRRYQLDAAGSVRTEMEELLAVARQYGLEG